MPNSSVLNDFKKIEELLAKQNSLSALEIVLSVRNRLNKKDKWFLGKTYFWENLCYTLIADDKKATSAAEKGIKIFQELGDFVEVSKILRDEGLAYEYAKKYDKALIKLQESIDTLRVHHVIDATGITFSKIGQIHLKKGDLDNARYYCELGYSICREGFNAFFLLTSILPLSLVYYKMGNHIAGLDLIEQAEGILKNLSKKEKFLNERRAGEISMMKALLYTGVNMFDESYESFLDFAKRCLVTTSQVRATYTKSNELKELLQVLFYKGFKLKITQYISSKLQIDVKELEKEIGITFT